MKEIVKEHPLRSITLQFDFDKPVQDFETKGLASHYFMHDLTWEIWQELKQHQQSLEELGKEINELEFLLLPIEQELDILEVFLGIQPPSVLPFDNKNEAFELSIDLDEYHAAIFGHSERMKKLYKPIIAEYNWFQAHFDQFEEKDSWIDDEHWDAVDAIYSNYQQAQVDIVTLDQDQEEFRTILSEVLDFEDRFMDYGDHIFEAYNTLHDRADGCYRRAEVASQKLNELK